MDIKVIVALIGLAGIGTSALVQYWLGRHSEKNKKVIETRFQAYHDLINVVSGISASGKHGEQRSLEQSQILTQSISRVVLIGSHDVVTFMHSFLTKYGHLNTDESRCAFSDIVSAMRADLSGEKVYPEKVLHESLFGKAN